MESQNGRRPGHDRTSIILHVFPEKLKIFFNRGDRATLKCDQAAQLLFSSLFPFDIPDVSSSQLDLPFMQEIPANLLFSIKIDDDCIDDIIFLRAVLQNA